MLKFLLVASPGPWSEERWARAVAASRVELPFTPTRRWRWSSPGGHVRFAAWERKLPTLPLDRVYEDAAGLTAFDGLPLLEAGMKTPAESLHRRACDVDDRIIDALRGVFSVVHLRQEAGFVAADPLGTALLFQGQVDGALVISNRATLVGRAIHPEHDVLPRDLLGAGWLLTIGHVIDGATCIEGVRVVSPGAIIRIRGEAAAVEEPNCPPLSTKNPAAHPLELAEGLIEDLKANIARCLAVPARMVVGLTGGRDSRLVLALLESSGAVKQPHYMTMGGQSDADVVIGLQLAERFGLRHSVIDSARPILSSAEIIGRLGAVSFVSCGLVPGRDLRGFPGPAESIVITGAFGELLRAGWGHRRRIDTWEDLDLLLAKFVGRHHVGGIVRPDIEDMYLQRARAIARAVSDELTPGDALHRFHALEAHRRSFAGQELLQDAEPRLYPLYTPQGAQHALDLDHEQRRSQQLIVAAINQLAPDLLHLPLEGTAFPAAGMEAIGLDPASVSYGPVPDVNVYPLGLKGQSVLDHRSLVADLLLDRTGPLASVLDLRRVESLLDGTVAPTGDQQRHLFTAMGVATWMLGNETATDVTAASS